MPLASHEATYDTSIKEHDVSLVQQLRERFSLFLKQALPYLKYIAGYNLPPGMYQAAKPNNQSESEVGTKED